MIIYTLMRVHLYINYRIINSEIGKKKKWMHRIYLMHSLYFMPTGI